MRTAATAPTVSAPVDQLLARLDAEQRAAALLPDSPGLVIAPAGSGKTTTLIARLGVLLARGVRPERIGVVTFNREAAGELRARITARLGSVEGHERIEVRTLHAMARQILLDAGCLGDLIADRGPLLRRARREAGGESAPDIQQLDTELSSWKVERREPGDEARPVLEAYQAALAARGALDFDDLVIGAVDVLEGEAGLRHRWQSRFSHLCVDEFQDVDAAQSRLVELLAEPERNVWVVGDDDQTIYAWRLADVRRILDFGRDEPGLHWVMLATNYRCPPEVVTASDRLISVNRERFIKPIRPAPGRVSEPGAIGAIATDDAGWSDRFAAFAGAEARSGRTCCFLGRTRADIEPVLYALVRAEVRHVTTFTQLMDVAPVRRLLELIAIRSGPPFPELLALRRDLGWSRLEPMAGRAADDGISRAHAQELSDDDHTAIDALLGWAVRYREVEPFVTAAGEARGRLAALQQPDALVEVATVHTAKGREWQTVVLVGFEEDRFPNRRALLGHRDPDRALEEERRLAYVALTRATERLILAFDPRRPSRFLAEMGYRPTSGATSVR
jgi:DNA helicase-2/ATP-dependent DNA helicase PcrA